MMHRPASWRIVAWPAGLTLAVTLLRLTGELLDWTPVLFHRAVGGGAAIVGIIWLVPVFGFYFGQCLAALGPPPLSRALGINLLALVLLAGFVTLGFSRPTASPSQFLAIATGSWIAIVVAHRAWPTLASTLLRYGLLARLPVVLVILLGILGDWRTHYDTPPPGLPEMGMPARWIAIGVIPQLTLWMAVTVVCGVFFGVLAVAVRAAGRPARRPLEA